MKKIRLDVLLTERGLVDSRALAQRLVMAGQVRVDGQMVVKPATKVSNAARLEIESGPPFVSRGGEKLLAALQAFQLTSLDGIVCADVGASTGGFTDALLQHGAGKVYAIDVGYGELHWKLRNDRRVVVMERTNARYVQRLPEPVSLVTVDASFISLKIILPVVSGWFNPSSTGAAPRSSSPSEREGSRVDSELELDPNSRGGTEPAAGPVGQVVALIKPQFEAGRAESARGEGVIRDPAVHRKVLEEVLGFALEAGYGLDGLIRSPLQGPKGNTEFLAHLLYPGQAQGELRAMVDSVLPKEEAGETPSS